MFYAALLAAVLLANGLAAGVLTASELGPVPHLARLPADQYVQAHAFYSRRFDPLMPICLIATMIGELVLTATGSGLLDRVLPGVGLVCVVTAFVIAVTRNVPLNVWVRTADPHDPPPDWQARRTAWNEWNRRRCILVVTALVANCATVVAVQ